MVLSFKTGSFTRRTSPGSQSITGIGFQPKMLLFIGNNTTENSFLSNTDFHIGFSDGVNDKNYSSTANDAQDPVLCNSRWHTSTIFSNSTTLSFSTLMAVTSFDSDGFTVNLSIATATASVIHYIAIAGDLSNVNVGQFNAPNATGDDAVTGIGFMPDFVMLLGTNMTSDDLVSDTISSYCVGACNGNGDQAVSSICIQDASSPPNAARYQRTNACLAMFNTGTAASLTHEASFSSMNSDGFTLNYSTASVANKRVAYLALKDCQTKIGTITSPTAGVAPVAQATTGIGFQPRGVIFQTVGNTSSVSIVDHLRSSFGFTDGTDQMCSWTGFEDVTSTCVTAVRQDNNPCIRVSDEAVSAASTTTQALADITSLDADGFELSWSVKDTNAYEIIYIAFGDAEAEAVTEDKKTQFVSFLPINEITSNIGARYTNTSMC